MKYFLGFSILLFSVFVSVGAYAQSVVLPETSAKQAYVVDFQTGTVLYNKNGEERMPTSSMSKVLTSIVVDDALRSGQISKDTKFKVSEKAWKTGGSRMFVDINTEVSVEDLLRGVVIQSGNDACVVLAEGVSGSEANFVVAMNQKAEEIGMSNSHFMNSNGWPDPNHYSTAEDLTKLAVYLIKNYQDEYKIYSEKDFTYNNIKQGNRNPLLYRNIGADGIKTGHTEDGGYGLMASAVAGDRRVVVVINGTESMQARADEGAKLTEWALTSFKNVKLMEKGAVMADVPVVLSDTKTLQIVAGEGYFATVPSFAKGSGNVTVTYKSPAIAPIKEGDVLGSASFKLPDGSLKKIPLIAKSDAPQASFFSRMAEKLMIMLVGVPE